jgi:hypothetical protein
MRRRITAIATISLAGLLSLTAWAQGAPPGADGTGGPNAAAPSGAAITHTPGTPGASDTPGALQSSHANGPAPTSLSPADIRALKKQARKASDSSAPVSDTSKNSSATPPR